MLILNIYIWICPRIAGLPAGRGIPIYVYTARVDRHPYADPGVLFAGFDSQMRNMSKSEVVHGFRSRPNVMLPKPRRKS
jgi:hypothetical protein